MCFVRRVAALICTSLLACLPAAASNLVTGNGFGFAVVSPNTGAVTKFYAHPYSFARPAPHDPLSEGIETANFIKSLGWSDGTAHEASAGYEADSNVLHVRSSAGEGLIFMPFGLRRTGLILNWNPASVDASRGELHVEWNRPLSSQNLVRGFAAQLH